MSYAGISIREAMEKLNALNGGWYLPYIQRQYVWGARYESEEYVCLLLDSLVKRYPIGGLVLWETTKPVAYRGFLDDYEPGKFTRQVEQGRWGSHKFLVYDGQQRLQTLRSVLYYTFNGRALHFNLLFDAEQAESDDTGFLFRDKDDPADPKYLKLTHFVSIVCDQREKVKLEHRVLQTLSEAQAIDEPTEILVRANLAALWDIFVDTNEKSIAYFPVKADDESCVNEVFRRLNTGGIALTEVEQALGEIKKHDQAYEQNLWKLSEKIRSRSNGVEFSAAQVLQFFHLAIKGTTRIDASRLVPDDSEKFLAALKHQDALVELFEGYLWGLFKINNRSVVPRWLAILPLGIYLTALKISGREWRVRALTEHQVLAMNTYFLSAQFCDWDTQTMVNAFAELAAKAGARGEVLPVEAFREIAVVKNRTGRVSLQQFEALRWFALKVLTPGRDYVFHENKPQLDHIFPCGLKDAAADYVELVDVLWNLQPIPDSINNFKRARHPKEFFNSADGTKYWQDYDFVPERDSAIWNDPASFVRYRRERMLRYLRERYRLQSELAAS